MKNTAANAGEPPKKNMSPKSIMIEAIVAISDDGEVFAMLVMHLKCVVEDNLLN